MGPLPDYNIMPLLFGMPHPKGAERKVVMKQLVLPVALLVYSVNHLHC